MELVVFDNMQFCTQADVNRLLPLVSNQRREQAMRFRHLFGQWACLKSYELLLSLLYPNQSIHSLSREQLPVFSYNEYGKPLLSDGRFFSISHCKQAIAVALSSTPIGVDVEHLRHVDDSLVQRTMNDVEQAVIKQNSDPSQAFVRLWTRKEAVLKWRGTGIIDDLKDVLSFSECMVTTQDFPTFVLSIAK